jgi:branched-subunit amino acid ABC-type transport system permease component
MSLALQVLVTGLAAGGVYGLVAIGHFLVYRLTGIVHFAFGDLVGLGVFVTLLVAAGTAPLGQAGVDRGRFALALLAGLLVCAAAGALSYTLAVEPYLTRGSTIGWIGATLAIAFAIRAALEAIFARPAYVVPDPFPFREVGRGGFVTVGGASIQVRSLYVVALALALAALATWTLSRTRFGRGLQAIASDQEGARIVGVPADRLIALAFGLAGAVAAVAAVAAAPGAPFAVGSGTLLGLKGLVAALVVGFASPWRAFAAGVGLGVVEAAIAGLRVGGLELGPEWREVLPLALALAWVATRRFGEVAEEARE